MRAITIVALLLYSAAVNAQQSLAPQWDTRAQHEREQQRKLALCMVELSTIADPDLRRWCLVQSKRLP